MSAAAARRIALAVALTVTALASAPTAVFAQQYYGAISLSPSSGALGWGFDYPTPQGAEEAAIRNCRKFAREFGRDCRIAEVFQNGCGAIAMGDRGYGSASSSSRTKAEQDSLEICRSESRNCTIMRWICTSGSSF